MELSCSLLLPPSLTRASPHSLYSCNSIFFNNGNLIFSKRKTTLVFSRTRVQNRSPCRCLFGLGVPELVVIAGVAALVFGPKKLPEVGRSIGKTVKSFQQAAKEFETELKKEPETTMVESPAEKSKSVSEEEEQDLKI